MFHPLVRLFNSAKRKYIPHVVLISSSVRCFLQRGLACLPQCLFRITSSFWELEPGSLTFKPKEQPFRLKKPSVDFRSGFVCVSFITPFRWRTKGQRMQVAELALQRANEGHYLLPWAEAESMHSVHDLRDREDPLSSPVFNFCIWCM